MTFVLANDVLANNEQFSPATICVRARCHPATVGTLTLAPTAHILRRCSVRCDFDVYP